MPIIMGFLATALATAPKGGMPAVAQVLPTVYEAGHFYAVPETMDGQKLKLLVDTGGGGDGGMYWLTKAAADRLHLTPVACMADGGRKIPVARVPDYTPGAGLPPPARMACGGTATLLVFADDYDTDGQLGSGYLPGRTWTFDYPARRLALEAADWHADASAHATALGFRRDDAGQRISGMPRIVIRVDGRPLDMLLDTGATAHPTAAGEKASGTPTVNGEGVASYITTSVLERWHKAHPDWRVVDKGDDLGGPEQATRLIEVPKVEIAGWTVGPVWFTERADANFGATDGGMSQYTDRIVSGAVGANVFRHFVMTLDYPRETVWFRCAGDCKPAATPPPAP
ncbi:hypothetical protein [Rhodanobacter sp. DHB23]|uniref:hypothetical protein n=1 Tax=Rhodanobacter sp. DHB23 TaxID=2775923 RepID=UPI00177D0034|nr:hypothetical protein [Rhodanobacter sp. DHB23]MBD8871211.1 hypothetical protein [Rhodanobacter sp. DHB23]